MLYTRWIEWEQQNRASKVVAKGKDKKLKKELVAQYSSLYQQSS
jgi:hypothetical protein